jgi:deoxycytidine triphosphate deaminase
MCILADADIEQAIADGSLSVAPFDAKDLTPNGLDLRVAEVFVKAEGRTVREGVAVVPSGAWFAVSTREVVTLELRPARRRRGLRQGGGRVLGHPHHRGGKPRT